MAITTARRSTTQAALRRDDVSDCGLLLPQTTSNQAEIKGQCHSKRSRARSSCKCLDDFLRRLLEESGISLTVRQRFRESVNASMITPLRASRFVMLTVVTFSACVAAACVQGQKATDTGDPGLPFGPTSVPIQAIAYVQDIKPIFDRDCLSCHSSRDARGLLDAAVT